MPTHWIAPDDSVLDFEPLEIREGRPSEWKPCTTKEAQAATRRKALKFLSECLKPDDTVYTILTHASASGMSHRHRVLLTYVTETGRKGIQDVTRIVADACGFRTTTKSGPVEIVQGGCGYSKSFEIVYRLGLALWPNGTPEPHGVRNGQPDSNGGYALNEGCL